MSKCICYVTDEKYWFRYGSAVEPGSQMEHNPDCPVHVIAVGPDKGGLMSKTSIPDEAVEAAVKVRAAAALRRAMTAEYVIETGASSTGGGIPGLVTIEQANRASERIIKRSQS